MGDEGRVPTSPIKPCPRPSGAVVFQRVRRTKRREGSGGRAGGLPSPLPPRPGALPRPLPRAHHRSYRNSAGSPCQDAPPGEQGRKGGPRRSGKRGKGRNSRNKPLGENQTNRVQAGRAQPPGRGRVWAPGGGGGLLGGSGHSASAARDWVCGIGSPEARAPRLRQASCDASPGPRTSTGDPSRRQELRPRPRPGRSPKFRLGTGKVG